MARNNNILGEFKVCNWFGPIHVTCRAQNDIKKKKQWCHLYRKIWNWEI